MIVRRENGSQQSFAASVDILVVSEIQGEKNLDGCFVCALDDPDVRRNDLYS